MTSVPEGATSYHSATFYNAAGADATPVTVTYKLLDWRGNILIDWTSATAGHTVSVTIPAAQNLITQATGSRRTIAFKGVNADGSVITAEQAYKITQYKSQ